MKRKILIISSCVVVILIIFGLLLLFTGTNNDNIIKQQDYIVEEVLISSNNTYEIRGYSDGKLYLYVNGSQSEYLGHYNTITQHIQLYDSVTITKKDITENPMIMDLTWKADLAESSGYIALLKSQGWVVDRQFCCPRYIELFLSKDEVIKRVIITNTFLMQGDLTSESVLPALSTYFESYDIKRIFD